LTRSTDIESFARDVRRHVFNEAATTARVPQAPEIASALGESEEDVRAALRHLAAGKVLILAPNSDTIWSANPFCAVPAGFRVDALGKRYSGICIWDALGIAAALDAGAVISAPCGDCGTPMKLEIRGDALTHSEGVVHFAVPAHHWWDNIGFT
jgi:hypothetical protein